MCGWAARLTASRCLFVSRFAKRKIVHRIRLAAERKKKREKKRAKKRKKRREKREKKKEKREKKKEEKRKQKKEKRKKKRTEKRKKKENEKKKEKNREKKRKKTANPHTMVDRRNRQGGIPYNFSQIFTSGRVLWWRFVSDASVRQIRLRQAFPGAALAQNATTRSIPESFRGGTVLYPVTVPALLSISSLQLSLRLPSAKGESYRSCALQYPVDPH